MVTFVCSYCDVTLKKKQLEKHTFGSCRPPSFICIDCHKTFNGNQYKAHTSCLTEFEKHWGEYAKPKQKSQQPQKNQEQPKPANSAQKEEHQEKKEVVKVQKSKEKVDPKQEKKVQGSKSTEKEGKEQEKASGQWRGWKNEINSIVKQEGNKIRKADLEGRVLKRYKQFGPEEDLESEQLRQLFQQKLGKSKKVKLETYVELK